MASNKENKFLSYFPKVRKNKILLFLFFIVAILCSYVIYYYQLDWIDFNCNHGRNAKSCIYKAQRLYLLPLIGFIGIFIFLFIDKITFFIVLFNNKIEGLSEKKSGLLLIIYSFIISCFLFSYRFSLYILDPTRVEWIKNMHGDIMLNFLSWHIFRDAPWEFPIGRIDYINHPLGTSIAYLDPTNLFAFIFKIFNNFLPSYFQYLGIWYFFCYVLQGLFAALIFKNIQCDLKLKLLAVPFLVFSTVLLDRLPHATLNAHWLILASFYLYFSKNISSNKKIIWQALIVYLTAWLHPYQTFMLYALMTALYLRIFFEEKNQRKYLTLIFSLTFIFVLMTWYAIGYFYLGGGYEYINFTYSSNFNTFINSMGNSIFLRPLGIGDGDYEGSAYLGLGVLIILVVLIFEKWPRENYVFKKENKALFWIVSILAFLATGFAFKFGEIKFLALHPPAFIEFIFGIYRSIGRFIWPAYYLIVIFSLLSLIYRERSIVKKYILVICALIVQLIDIYPLYKPIPLNIAKGFEISRDFSPWEKFMGKEKNKIIFYPNRDYPYSDFWLLSKKNNYSINIGYFARNNQIEIEKNESLTYDNILNGKIPNDTVYVVGGKFIKIITSSNHKNKFTCEYIQEFYACKSKN
ncbi:DUF6311 domain-containing protein [Fluviispira sanaruensis]|uniref:Glycosyltransferase RgtA/B/C/D-like domain-containing protein n=1 Tax=Fluviispira sanaruensis TaxID=2493639 RepID=A0A4P2VL18_FLUSA|nr:DUF6311 domain-containing protein [Fluviispira sanaruensis]BBH52624.1 hypothetical protein JCM31447_10650 [Fluviispira sanaruensis]